MKRLGIDIETFSSVDLKKSGLYKYVESPDFEVLMIAASYDGEPPEMYDLQYGDEEIPEKFCKALFDKNILKTAYNAAFEITCLSKFFSTNLDPKQWSCTMVLGAYLGLPFSLEKAGAVLKLNTQKDKLGKSLIKYFSVPRKPTKRDVSIRKFPRDAPDKWQQFKDYCVTDVVVEQGIREHISRLVNLPWFERRLWFLDQGINARGVKVDTDFVKKAINIDQQMRNELLTEAELITGLNNPNSTAQVKAWLEEELQCTIGSMDKKHIEEVVEQVDALAKFDNKPLAPRVLEIWRELNKTSVKKYYSMMLSLTKDGKNKGMFQFYGAQRTGRWAGRGVQLHNLASNKISDLHIARQVVSTGDYELLKMIYSSPSFILSQLIRTSFIPHKGNKLIISDFSAIEARVTAWFAQEKWRLEVFAGHGKIYEASASMMFGLPIEQCQKGTKYREQGKVAELALGYGGGVNALMRMDTRGDIPTDEYKVIVDKWRKASPNIKKLWYELNNAAVGCIEEGGVWEVAKIKGKFRLRFWYKNNVMYIELPCGRKLMYYNAKTVEGQFGQIVTYEGMNQVTGKWERQSTYGGKLLENIVQATSRDLLAEKMLELEEENISVIMHVHDEIVTEVPQETNIKIVDEIMARPVEWAPGLPLKGDSYESAYYRKD